MPVSLGEIILGLTDPKKTRIISVYNNLYPYKVTSIGNNMVFDQPAAYDLVWDTLRVHGPLIEEPKISLIYLPYNKLITPLLYGGAKRGKTLWSLAFLR